MSLYEFSPRRKELIERLREVLNMPEMEITDKDILDLTRKSFLFARIELGMSLSLLKIILKREIMKTKRDFMEIFWR